MNDSYEIIQPPFTLVFREMSKKELRAYYDWFLAQVPQRIDILINAVHATTGYEDWSADYSPDSLNALGKWFAGQVETRDSTPEEIEEIYRDSPAWFQQVEIDTRELTNRTFSLAIDIGMYMSQVFLRHVDGLSWKHVIKGSKNYVDYGQPVITGFGSDEFNPARMLVVLAYSISSGKKAGEGLRNLYDIWKKFA